MPGDILRRFSLRVAVILIAISASAPVRATVSYTLENPGDSMVGAMETVQARHEDTLPDIARANGLGFREIKLANPGVDTWLPGQGTEIVLPTRHVLPGTPKVGIVLNIPEMRLYYYPPQDAGQASEVITHPIGVGRQGWATPYLDTRIIQKKTRPSWYPPESIRKEHAEMGDPLPKRVPPGPKNPLGNYMMRLGMPEYIIHGTNKPFGIGMRVSHGCIRLYPENIKSLYQQVKLNTPVRIVNQPYKVGRLEDKIYLEAHPYLEEDTEQFEGNLTSVVEMLIDITGERGYQVDWDLVKTVIAESNGIPVEIGLVIAEDPEEPEKQGIASVQ
jgi:L,D-transpeptidase ErfK/SrfK